MNPGEVIPDDGAIKTLPGAARIELGVTNTGDRPVQVGSHFHFAQANRVLLFDRSAARGHRLDVAAGTAVGLTAGGGPDELPRPGSTAPGRAHAKLAGSGRALSGWAGQSRSTDRRWPARQLPVRGTPVTMHC